MAKEDSALDGWFVGKPAEAALRRVCDVILSADRRMRAYPKYGTIVFGYEGDCVSFVQHDKKTVSLMFNRGARIPGRFPHLEGTGPTARFMRFAEVPEVNSRAGELGRIVVAWCDLMAKQKSSSVARKK